MRLAPLALVAGAACASGPRVQTDAARGVNFTPWSTFALTSGVAAGDTGQVALSPEIRIRAELSVRDVLGRKGWREVAPDAAPDLLVAVHGGGREAGRRLGDPYAMWAPGATANSPNVARTAAASAGSAGAQVVEVGTLVVDAYDPAARRVVWRGSATDAVSSRREIDEKLPGVVARILERFPAKP